MRRGARALLASLFLPVAAAALAAGVNNPRSFVHLTTRSWFTLDPAAAFDAVSFIVVGNVYEPLIAFKSVSETGSFVPLLAAKVPSRANGLLSEDGTSYEFPIREGVRFHDGTEMTPEDVRYSLLRFMLADHEGGPSALLLGPVLGVYSTRGPDGKITLAFKDAADAVTVKGGSVVVRLKRPDASFLKALASLPIIVSRKWAAANGDWDGEEATWREFNNRPVASSPFHDRMNGTGPFLLGAAATQGTLSLSRHDRYWRPLAALENVFLRVVPSRALRLEMLENGDADSSYFENRDFPEVRMLSGVRIIDDQPLSTLGAVLFFNFDADPASERLGSGKLDGKGIPPDFFADRKVREGFARAIDYEAYLKRGLCMRGVRAPGPIPPALLPSRGGPRWDYDLKKAAKALRKAHDGKLWETGFTATLTYSRSNASRIVLAELLKAGLEKINPKFRLEIETVDSGALYEAAEKRALPLFISGYYSDYPDPQSFAFGMLHSSGYFPKAQSYRNAEIDALLETASAASDPGKRSKAYRKALKLAAKEGPHVTTYYPKRFTARRDWVRGMEDPQNVANLALNGFPYFYAYSKGE